MAHRHFNGLKTAALLGLLTSLILLVGYWLGGTGGLVIAVLISLVMNAVSYFWSDKIALRAMRARPVSEAQAPQLYAMVGELSAAARQPMPALYVSPTAQPNAFATGRNPHHASVSVTRGLLQVVDQRELRGVLAHEISHVANHDILISSIAAAIGSAITWLAYMAFWFGGSDDEGGNPIVGLLAVLLAPLALRAAAERERRQKVSRWLELHHLAAGDPQSWSAS